MVPIERTHRLARHRPVKGHGAGPRVERQQEGRDVGEADDRLRAPREGVEVDAVEVARDAEPAADAPDRVDLGVGQCGVEIGQPLVVGPGEVSVVAPGVGPEPRRPAEFTAEGFGP